MGSAYEWGEDSQTLCNHTIPAEIVAKIVNKIRVRAFVGERTNKELANPKKKIFLSTQKGVSAPLFQIGEKFKQTIPLVLLLATSEEVN